jgi:hypothetical protein
MKRRWIWLWIPLLLAILLLEAPLQVHLLRSRTEEGTSEAGDYRTIEPGEFIGTVLLGGFRAVAIDILWVRSISHLERGEYFEAVALFHLIAKLQPYLDQVWIFNGWVLAYDIPPREASVERRWHWIKKGAELILEGRRKNPGSWKIPYYLGFIYYHRCGLDPYLARMLEKDRELNPEGLDRIRLALRWFERANALPDHPCFVDWRILHCRILLLEEALRAKKQEEAERHKAKAWECVRHVEAAHPDGLKTLALWKQKLKEYD